MILSANSAFQVLVVLVRRCRDRAASRASRRWCACRAAPGSDRCRLKRPRAELHDARHPAGLSRPRCAANSSSMVSAPMLHFSARLMLGSKVAAANCGLSCKREVQAEQRPAGVLKAVELVGESPPAFARARSGPRRSDARRWSRRRSCGRARCGRRRARCRWRGRPRSRCARSRTCGAKVPPAAMKVSIRPRARLNEPPWQS